MLLGSFTAKFSFGLLVIAAPESKDPHVDWDTAAEAVHAGPDSIYMSVRDAASGFVNLVCEEEGVPEEGMVEVFSGYLDLPSARLKFYDPDETILMVVPVAGRRMAVKLYVDDVAEPSAVRVNLADQ